MSVLYYIKQISYFFGLLYYMVYYSLENIFNNVLSLKEAFNIFSPFH